MKSRQIIIALLFIVKGFLIFVNCSSNSSNSSTNPIINQDNQIILRYSSEHFNFYCIQSDEIVLDTISFLLETSYTNLEILLNYSINDTIDVFIYPDLESFHTNANWLGANPPDWFIGQCNEKDVIKLVSPLNPGPAHSYESVLGGSVHEFAHAFNYQIVRTRQRIPVWLFEGFASYAARFPLPNTNIIRQRINNGVMPTLEYFDNDSHLVDENLYSFSYTVVEYIVNEYGYENLSQFLKIHTRYEDAFGVGITEEVFEAGWQQFVIDNYS